jgi:FMN phosphatase YigB (HAD superfamily)
MLTAHPLVFLFDVDNTLLDNDRFGADLSARLERSFGAAGRDRYWMLYTALRQTLSYADYLGALQQFRAGQEDHPDLLQLSSFMLDYPFAERLYPRALEAIQHVSQLGLPVILSDGDVVFQPRKILRSGLWDAVAGRVLIDVHKERSIDAMRRRFPAGHYVMIDDKAAILATMKRVLGDALTTVFVRQGHYAAQVDHAPDPLPDVTIDHIGDLIHFNAARFVAADRREQA